MYLFQIIFQHWLLQVVEIHFQGLQDHPHCNSLISWLLMFTINSDGIDLDCLKYLDCMSSEKVFVESFRPKHFSEDTHSTFFILTQTIYCCVLITITTPMIIIIISCILFVIPIIVVTSNMGKLFLCFCSWQEIMYAYMHIWIKHFVFQYDISVEIPLSLP